MVLPQESIHPARSCQQYDVLIQPSGITVSVQAGESIVEAIRRQGYRTKYKCRRGGCGACRAVLIEGHVTYPTPVCESVLDGPEPRPTQTRCLPCRATPQSDLVIELGPRDRLVDVIGALAPERRDTPPATDEATTAKEIQCP